MDQQTQIPADIRTYLENLIEDAGMQLTPELQNSMIEDLYVRLEKKLIADAVENMKGEDTEEFIKLVQGGADPAQMQAFVNEHIPNAKEVFVQSLVDFRNYFLDGSTKANTQPVQT